MKQQYSWHQPCIRQEDVDVRVRHLLHKRLDGRLGISFKSMPRNLELHALLPSPAAQGGVRKEWGGLGWINTGLPADGTEPLVIEGL